MPIYVPRDELESYIGKDLEPSEWFQVTQERIDKFAEATMDDQFIHVDPEKAKETSFGGTIAHGYLTLALITRLAYKTTLFPEHMQVGVNHGLNSLRFVAPVKVDSYIRICAKIVEVELRRFGQIMITSDIVIEVKDQRKPAIKAQTVSLYITKEPETSE
jgi:acyl dehydratase